MNTSRLNNFINPFQKITGYHALLIGFPGFVLATFLGYWNNWHYHGLLLPGSYTQLPFWGYAGEILIVWLVISALFYIGGRTVSHSKISIVNVLGATSIALLPILGVTLIALIPLMKPLFYFVPAQSMEEIWSYMTLPRRIYNIWMSLFSFVFIVWLLVWLWEALKVSCNLKGTPLTVVFFIAVFGGEAISRLLIYLFRCWILN